VAKPPAIFFLVAVLGFGFAGLGFDWRQHNHPTLFYRDAEIQATPGVNPRPHLVRFRHEISVKNLD
jgi:hypothetical protein